nr:hypothetical protein [Elizabethkingia sp. ASV34]
MSRGLGDVYKRQISFISFFVARTGFPFSSAFPIGMFLVAASANGSL